MKHQKLAFALSILATLATGSMQAIKPLPKRVQDLPLLQRLVMQYQINLALIKQSPRPPFTQTQKREIKRLQAQRNDIIRRAVLAGIFPAFRAAIETKKALTRSPRKTQKPRPRPPN